MTPNRLITIAIHTVEKALPLKNLLEREGIYVELNNVNLASPTVAAGVRIRIKESDLPLALRIIENIEIFDIPARMRSQRRVESYCFPLTSLPIQTMRQSSRSSSRHGLECR